MSPARPTNRQIAAHLQRIADLLTAKGENPFRVRSYRAAAQTISGTSSPIHRIVASKGVEGLTGLKGIGDRIAGLIGEIVSSGSSELLLSLEKEVPAEKVKNVVRDSAPHVFEKPIGIELGLVLEIDSEYREKAKAGRLKKIAPRLMNPGKKAWLPILSTEKKGYKFTVMFSNTERAHELGKTNDWVVVYFSRGKGENQCTVVTEQRGPYKGKRIVRGREKECGAYYGKRGDEFRS